MNEYGQRPFQHKSIGGIELSARMIQLEIQEEAQRIHQQFTNDRPIVHRWHCNNVQVFLVKTVDTDTRVEYKIISTMPGFSYRKRINGSLPLNKLTQEQKDKFAQDVQRDFERAQKNPLAREWYR